VVDVGARVEDHVDGVVPPVVDQTVPVEVGTTLARILRYISDMS
jgi:hypothetical protein